MIGFLFFILAFILIIVLVVISTVLGFIRSIFGFGRRGNNYQSQQQSTQSQGFEQPTPKSKIFDKNEGEYVDYEEIK